MNEPNLLGSTPTDARTSLPTPSKDRWQLLRAGLQNIWEYDDQRFVFHHGRLLLRGRNESGKSKALEVLLPFLLDADLSPQRLDPFGSTSRPMYWNLINDQNPEVNVNIGYLWIEFGRKNGNASEFCTIGAGLRAKRGTPGVDARYFITPLRVDQDWNPLGNDRIPITPSRLGDVFQGKGHVFERSADYRREVNSFLFGMAEEQYCALIEALLELRRPQLSKRLDLPELSRVLSVSLPPLNPETIGRLAEGFERLDRLREERNQLGQTSAALETFLKVYRKYLHSVAKARASEITQSESEYQKRRGLLREAQGRITEADQKRATLSERITSQQSLDLELDQQIEGIKASREYEAIQQLDRLRQLAEESLRNENRVRAKADRDRTELQHARSREEAAVNEVKGTQQIFTTQDRRTEAAAREAGLHGPQASISRQLSEGATQAARGTGEGILSERRRAITEADQEHKLVTTSRDKMRRMEDRRATAANVVDERMERLRSREGELERAVEAFGSAVSTWLESSHALVFSPQLAEELLSLPVDRMKQFVDQAAAELRSELVEQLSLLTVGKKELDASIEIHERERNALEADSHKRPDLAAWRTPRSPREDSRSFYLLCEFAPGIDENTQGKIEGAIQAAGLLDARVTSDGRFMPPQGFDLLLESAPLPNGTPTLADVLIPVVDADTPIAATVIKKILSSIGYRRGGIANALDAVAPFWISDDGSFQAGPLHGFYQKEHPEFLGAASRERVRRERIQALNLLIRDLRSRRELAFKAIEENRTRTRALLAEQEQFPSLVPVQELRATVEAETRNLAEAQAALAEAEFAAAEAATEYHQQEARYDETLVRTGLLEWGDRLAELREKHQSYESAFRDLIQCAYSVEHAKRRLQDFQKATALALFRFDETSAEHLASSENALKLKIQAESLSASLGADPKALLRRMQSLESERRSCNENLVKARGEITQAEQDFGAALSECRNAEAAVEQQDSLRQETAQRFRAFAAAALLDEAGLSAACAETESPNLDSKSWTLTETLHAARAVAAGSDSSLTGSPEEREKFENRVNQQHQDLLREFAGDVRLTAERTGDVLIYMAGYNGQIMNLSRLIAELGAEIKIRDRLLADDERQVFESFLSGETHEHLRARVREARHLIDRMNAVLLKCPTASGSLVRLQWEVTESAPRETEQVIRLLLRAGHLLSDSERSGLRGFLAQRLEEARLSDGSGSYHERMMKTLDYRSWFEFKIEYKDSGTPWKLLTRKRHGEGSGGKKAVMLHLPLFAAAAAFFESASPSSPRLILLDEAFAGIDPTIRGQLMTILSEFDLDFVMTSYEEWGFYAELDGLSTYHLSRETGLRGVLAEWFLWDGKSMRDMGD
ncbi:MAG: TIGR02680 family protein [Oligoflexia bacterium]|nr:TIGR02680 family protein [Oligoflexia bacterium]